MKNKTKFNWQCCYCGKRNISTYKFQFNMPQIYTNEVYCCKCGKENELVFSLSVRKRVKYE